MRYPINDDWEYTDNYFEGFAAGEGEFERVRLPHSVSMTCQNYCDSADYQKLSGYRLCLPSELCRHERCFARFMGAAHEATVLLNGRVLMVHRCGYTAFTVELKGLRGDGSDILCVRLDSRESLNQPPFGGVIDYLTYGGLYREAYILGYDGAFIADAFVCASPTHMELEFVICGKPKGSVRAEIPDLLDKIFDLDKLPVADCDFPVLGVAKDECLHLKLPAMLMDFEPWSLDNPKLYELKLSLSMNPLESCIVRFGARSAEFCTDGFYLNGVKTPIVGLNRHQCYPYVGYAAPASLQRADAKILKNELGVNAVRTSHYPQAQSFIDCCDELGLMVFTEIPGWQHIGDEAWQDVAVSNAAEMVTQYRNHPSVVLWGVRVNESADCHALYERTNATAHALDPHRQTSGVRFIEHSELLEDVYAYNDFTWNGRAGRKSLKKSRITDKKAPIFVSEYNGHMYPCKPFDDEAHRAFHAKRHALVTESIHESHGFCGSFAWCMFDYPTHEDFGSGDRVCYHGVMDAYRNPKLAAAFYASCGLDTPVLCTSSELNIGDSAGGLLGDFDVYTNADFIRLYRGDELVGEFFPSKNSALPHPPICVNDRVGRLLNAEGYSESKAKITASCLMAIARYGQRGLPIKYLLKLAYLMSFRGMKFSDGYRLYSKYVGNWGDARRDYRIDAVRDGRVVKSLVLPPKNEPRLELEVSGTSLVEGETYDAALVRMRVVDENGNVLHYFQDPISFETEGCIELVGAHETAFMGGMSGCIVQSVGKSGKAALIVRSPRLEEKRVDFEVKVT